MGRGQSTTTPLVRRDEAFRDKVASATARFHRQPATLKRNDALYAVLIDLYADSPDAVWTDKLEPFVREHAQALAIIYDEHEVLPEADVLDLVEGLLVLERLKHDSARLRERWPLAPWSLSILAAAWGTPLEHVS